MVEVVPPPPELPFLLDEIGVRSPAPSLLGSARSRHSVGMRSAASLRFSERSMASGLSMKCVQCAMMGIRICSHCTKKSSHVSGRPQNFAHAEKRKSKVELAEDSPETLEMVQCLQEDVLDLDTIRDLLKEKRSAVNIREASFGWSPLLFAAHRGDTKLVSMLLDSKANINSKCHQGNTALHLAARRGNISALSLIHSRGADLEVQNAQGWTPLLWTAIAGCSSIASSLIDAHADTNVRDNGGRNACMWAARHGHTEILHSLLSMGVDLSLRDEDGFTIKDHASYYKDMQKSIGARASINSDENHALYWATDDGSLDLNRLLMQHGASLQSIGGSSSHGAPLQAVKEAILRSKQLLEAARHNNWDAAEEALRAGACASTRGEADLISPLTWAAIHNAPAAVFSLVAAMADLESCDSLGWTALHHAVHAKSAQTVAVLHYLGADFSAKTEEGDSVQHLAALSDAGQMLQLLGPATPDWNIKDASSHTPLQVAAIRGCLSAVRALLALKADADVKDNRGKSILMQAVAHGHEAVARTLIEPVDALPQIWKESDLITMMEKLPWVDSDVVDGASHRGRSRGDSSSNASVCSGLTASCNSSISARNDKLGTKLADKLMQRKKDALHMKTIKEADSEAASVQSTPRADRPQSAGSQTSQKSAAMTHVSSQSRAASVAKSVKSQASVKSAASIARSGHSCRSLARSAQSLVSLRSKTSHTSALSRSTSFSRASMGGRSRMSAGGRAKLSQLSSLPPTIYSMAMTVLDRSPVSLMSAACKISSDTKLPPPIPLGTALSAADDEGSTALLVAARTRQSELVRWLLSLKATPNTTDAQGNTALMIAAAAGDKHIVESLLGAGAVVTSQNTAGHQAVDVTSNAEICQVLQAELDRSAVEKQISRSCSLPSLVKAKPRPHPKSKADSVPKSYRVRLDGLRIRAAADDLEAEVRQTLKSCRVASPIALEVVVDPIMLYSRGHAFLEYGSTEQAQAVVARLIECVDDEMLVSIVDGSA